MKNFYPLEVSEIIRLTNDSVCIHFDVSSIDNNIFSFVAGQYITLQHSINGEDVRRSYSISCIPNQQKIEIGVKRVKNGLMSTFLTRDLKIGDKINVMPPTGNFMLTTDNSNSKHYMAICAGSGITPALSMIQDVLCNEPNSSFTLLYGNKNRSSVMFMDDILRLEKDFQSQFLTYHFFSRENVQNSINGRINSSNLTTLFQDNASYKNIDEFFICGPGEMIDTVSDFIRSVNIDSKKIQFERFTSKTKSEDIKNDNVSELISNVSICVDGDDFEFTLSSTGDSILDAAMNEGADVPFSCKGGVCCVCKAKLTEGTVSMEQNFSLSQEEVEQGYILTCQSHPTSENVVVDFDEI